MKNISVNGKKEFNIAEEANALKLKTASYNKEDIVDMMDWDGDCWGSFFEKICIPFAIENNMEDPWDVFAVLIHKMLIDDLAGV